jgi:hypothetical protein
MESGLPDLMMCGLRHAIEIVSFLSATQSASSVEIVFMGCHPLLCLEDLETFACFAVAAVVTADQEIAAMSYSRSLSFRILLSC